MEWKILVPFVSHIGNKMNQASEFADLGYINTEVSIFYS